MKQDYYAAVQYYYACIEYKDGHVDQIRFEDRKEANNYISDSWDEEECVQAWIVTIPFDQGVGLRLIYWSVDKW